MPDSVNATSTTQLLGGLTTAQFLAEYWQKKPLLIRQALPGIGEPIEADELAGLACEEQVESRIIRGSGAGNDWQQQHGPFDEQIFGELGDRDWTLLVQAVDHYIPEVAELKQRFRFIPDWRLDDVMVSFAAAGGSVGPHLDQYDVFLLQGQGRRNWQVGERITQAPALLPHPELQLLRDFNCSNDYVLEPGDMLYLPPGFPHWGIAVDPCTTYSIGFRAPSHQEIISHYVDHALAAQAPQLRYSDAGVEPTSHPGLIDAVALKQLRDIIASLLDEQQIADWFGRYMTAPKYDGDDVPSPIEEDDILNAELELHVESASRLAFSETGESCSFYADGEHYRGKGKHWRTFVSELCAQHYLDFSQQTDWQLDTQVRATLKLLLQRGVLTRE